MVTLTFTTEEELVGRKVSKTRNWGKSWRKIVLKRKKNLHMLSELLNKQFSIATQLFVLY